MPPKEGKTTTPERIRKPHITPERRERSAPGGRCYESKSTCLLFCRACRIWGGRKAWLSAPEASPSSRRSQAAIPSGSPASPRIPSLHLRPDLRAWHDKIQKNKKRKEKKEIEKRNWQRKREMRN